MSHLEPNESATKPPQRSHNDAVTPNDNGHFDGKAPPSLTSQNTGVSDTSSIFLVDDYGFAAASESSQVVSEGREVPEDIMDVRELQSHLGLEYVDKWSIAKSLAEKLQQSLDPCVTDGHPSRKEYLPMDRLYNILSVESISALMNELHHGATRQELCTKVADIIGDETKCRRRILAILLCMDSELLNKLDVFIRGEIWDKSLPLKPETPESNLTSSTDLIVRATPAHVDTTTLFKGWTRNDLHLFNIYQEQFQVPFFDLRENRLCFYKLPPNMILPWVSIEHIAVGGSGAVYRVEIHSSHHNYKGHTQVRNIPHWIAA